MQTARIAQSMMSVTIVLFALATYRSPAIAGAATFFSILPGLLVSPVAGALLDRHGRTRLVVLDYLIALGSLTLLGVLALAQSLPPWLLIVIAAVSSLTTPLSGTGLRSLFPLIVPQRLWERLNAIDSAGFVIATVIGPPLAAGLVAVWGGAVTLIVIGFTYGVAALVVAKAPDPPGQTSGSGLLVDAWHGLVYTWRNPTLRGLGFSLSLLNLVFGIFTIIVPLIVLERLRLDETVVGLVFAVQGGAGVVSAVFFGRMDTRNRERTMLAVPMVGTGIAAAMLLYSSNLAVLTLVMVLTGFLNGPLDIGLFTLRQRRTDPVWTGRAFAVSMSFNYLGIPIGSAIAGVVATRSIEAAVAIGVVTSLVAGVLAMMIIPEKE
jgi:predicted MFS family arabinose efflux permease